MNASIRAVLATASSPAPTSSAFGGDLLTVVSDVVVWLVLALLILASVGTWAVVVRKAMQLRAARRQSVGFLEAFWQSKRLDAIYQAAENLSESPISQVFKAGYVELTKISKDGGPTDVADLENVERALRRAKTAETTHLESQTNFLASTASAAPFIGLLGTVAGIMGAFHEISLKGSASLDVVAAPIADALIATGVGLFAAIPASIFYNYFMAKIGVLEAEMENFSIDFLNIVRRHFFKKAGSTHLEG
ncbi:MAG: flagellar motor protein MotA [Deltaproteobacteria bacterium]|nr:MAG: flagellar motor protein MotA [Deltaproteobacteria bacterium]